MDKTGEKGGGGPEAAGGGNETGGEVSRVGGESGGETVGSVNAIG